MDAAKDQAPRVRQVPVCAIGASAGGVRALQQFFRGIRDDLGLAYVVIVHLSPEHESQLSEILAGRTRMPVRQVVDSPELEPNCVYVIPPDRELVIEDNAIRARPFSEPRGQRAPIDMFFRSIAAGRGDGMAVVLSGAGSDGALGVRKVKEAGGVIFVQEPSEAEFGMMPRSAMATGVADFVEPIDRMVERIAEVARSKEALRRLGTDEADEDLRRILGFLRARVGHDFSAYKRATVLRRIARRMAVTRMLSLADYATYLRETPEEAQNLFSDLLISVTAFFRDPAAFEAVAHEVFGRCSRTATTGRGTTDAGTTSCGCGRWAAPPARRPTASPSCCSRRPSAARWRPPSRSSPPTSTTARWRRRARGATRRRSRPTSRTRACAASSSTRAPTTASARRCATSCSSPTTARSRTRRSCGSTSSPAATC